jgi:hypothetical protein
MPQQMLHIKGLTLPGRVQGVSPITQARLTLDLNQSAAYQERALRQDRTMLFDCMCLVADESQAIRDELLALMDSATPTTAMPGSKDKVATMEARAKAGYSIFIDGDSR